MDKVEVWDLVFLDEEYRWTDNDDGEPKEDPDDPNINCNPLGKFLKEEDAEEESKTEPSSSGKPKKKKDFSWLADVSDKDTYFTLVNQSGRTIKKGEQLFYRYGCKSNASLLMHYSFSYPGNKYDFQEMLLHLKPTVDLDPANLVCLD
jgi:hypothetical protein